MTSVQTSTGGGNPTPLSFVNDAQTQTDAPPQSVEATPSDTLRASQNRQAYRPPHQLNSPDASHAGSAALLAAQNTTSPTAWTYDGSAGASAAASRARAQSKPIEAWKPDKLSSAGAAASLAHRSSISERTTRKEASAGAATALRSPHRSSFESHDPAPLAVSSAGASLTNSTAHAMRAASMAHKPSLSKSPEQLKSSPPHALRAASAADRESAVQKPASPPRVQRSAGEEARIQMLARQLAQQELSASGGVSKSDLTRAASISMARKQASDKAEVDAVATKRKQVEVEAREEWIHQQELDDAARRIVAERIARVTLTGEEGDEVLAGKAAGDAIHRGDKRVRDWERVLKELAAENKQDKEKNVGWLRHSMRQQTAPNEPNRQDPALIMEAAKRNVKSQLGEMDKSIAQEQMILGKPTGENLAKRDAATKELQEKGAADLERTQKERASTYDIGGMIMTHEQVEAIAQKHVNEVLAEINEKVEREKERIEQERIERETKAREKQHEKDIARDRKAEEKRVKEETKAAEKKKKADEKTAQKELKTVQKEQLAVGEGLAQYDAQKEKEAEFAERRENLLKERALNQAQTEQMAAVGGVLEFDETKEKQAEFAHQYHEKVAQEDVKDAQKELAGAVGGVLEYDDTKAKQEEFASQYHDKQAKQELRETEKDLGKTVGGVMEFDAQKDKETAFHHQVEEAHKQRELTDAQKEQAAAVGGVLEFDSQKDKEAAFMQQVKDAQTDRALNQVQGEQLAAVDGGLQFDQQKENEAVRKQVVERHKANQELAQATSEQAHAAEVVLHPDTALDDDSKRHKLKSWLKEKKDKIGKRLSRGAGDSESPVITPTTSPTKKEVKPADEEEDIYGSQPLATTNWSGSDRPRETSLKDVALAKTDEPERPKTTDSEVQEPKHPVPLEINDLSAYKSAGYEDVVTDDEEYDDAEEEFEEDPGTSSHLGVKDEGRKVSSERGSRFKEEF